MIVRMVERKISKYHLERKYGESRDPIEKALNLQPDMPEALVCLGIIYD
jgi:hypothetical protein